MKFTETENRVAVARGWGRGRENGEMLFNGYRISILQDENNSRNWLHSNVHIPNIIQSYLQKWLRW